MTENNRFEVVDADTIDHAAAPAGASTGRVPIPRRLRLPLATLEDTRRELARVYRAVKTGAIASDEGTRRTYILVSLGKLIEAAEFERRIAALEAQGGVTPPEGPDDGE
jgi:hypothetical protein